MRYMLFFLLFATPVWAQNAKPVWDTEYQAATAQTRTVYPADTSRSPANASSLPPRPGPAQQSVVKRGDSAAAAWSRQWTPIQNLTGFSQGQAQQFIAGVRKNYIQGSKETIANARDWATILGSTGIVGDVTATGKEWFGYVSQDLPNALISQDPALLESSTNLMGGGLGSMGYPGAAIPAE